MDLIHSRRKVRRTGLPFVAVATIAALLTACGSSGSGGSSGTTGSGSSSTPAGGGQHLTVGTSADFPPVSFKKPGSSQIVGFEDDMLKTLTHQLGDTYGWQQLDFNGLIPALQSGRLDLIVSGLYDTAERRKVVDFVDYMKIPLAVMTQKSKASSVKGPMDLCGKSVAYLVGSPPEVTQLDQWSSQCKKAGKSGISPTGYQSVSEAVANVTNGRTFAEIEGDIVVLYIANTQYRSKIGVAFDVPGGTSTIGVAVKKGSSLLPKLQTAMTSYINSQQYCTDAQKWQLTPADLMRQC